MLSLLHPHDPSETLQREIRDADVVTADLVAVVLELALARCAASRHGPQPGRIRELIAARAWTDAALALLGLDRSRVLRHLIYEEAEWRCALGSLWPAPAWLDDTVEFAHPELPLAILGAVVGALRQQSQPASAPVSVPRSRAEPCDVAGYVDCDNFA
jgi:hypothetical protein